jgi:hypothetical protein
MNSNFSDDGFIILPQAINKKTINSVQKHIYTFITERSSQNVSSEDIYNKIVKKFNESTSSEFSFMKPIFDYLLYKECFNDILTNKILLDYLTDLLGKDLSYCAEPSITINIPKENTLEKNYLFKDWHQEIWSGASPSTAQIWTPLLHKNSSQGQMQLITGSHKWGHIPHRNRKPIGLPKNIQTQEIHLEYGDVIIFSTLLLHRSVPTNSLRMSLPLLLRNFRQTEFSYQKNRNWRIFSISEITKIERMLGNHYLSPLRLKE